MNPNDLIDQSTGKIVLSQVMRQSHARAAFLARAGLNYREQFAIALRNSWETARNYAGYWQMAHSGGSGPMMYTGGNQGLVSGLSHEGSV